MEQKNDEGERMVSAFEHENALMHYGRVNKRSMIMLICVCVTFILVTLTYVIGGIVRDKNREAYWLDVVRTLTTPGIAEVDAGEGVHQQPNP